MMAAQPDPTLDALLGGSLTAPVYEALLAHGATGAPLELVDRCVRALDARERYDHEAAEALARAAARHLAA
ncbi:MAG: hypothetical protein JWM10_4136, partial [Myxococcaceae bacterium]|nr:hypothetical protein [Myxococcaceae bacterium]